MVITILAEPRSGSTNLAKWFSMHKDFTVLFEPFNSDMKTNKWYKFGESPTIWKYDTKHFLIKEIYNKTNTQLDELISISDKIIILYREDIKTQTESWINAHITKNWDNGWAYKGKINVSEDVVESLYDIKSSLKADLIDSNRYFTISYEELYYNNGFQRIIDYIDLPEVQNIDFPYGTKYRVDGTVNKLI
jgi:hypothetical protein